MGGLASFMISRVTAQMSLLCTCLAQGRGADRALKSGCCSGSSRLLLLLEGGFLRAIRPAWRERGANRQPAGGGTWASTGHMYPCRQSWCEKDAPLFPETESLSPLQCGTG